MGILCWVCRDREAVLGGTEGQAMKAERTARRPCSAHADALREPPSLSPSACTCGQGACYRLDPQPFRLSVPGEKPGSPKGLRAASRTSASSLYAAQALAALPCRMGRVFKTLAIKTTSYLD